MLSWLRKKLGNTSAAPPEEGPAAGELPEDKAAQENEDAAGGEEGAGGEGMSKTECEACGQEFARFPWQVDWGVKGR